MIEALIDVSNICFPIAQVETLVVQFSILSVY